MATEFLLDSQGASFAFMKEEDAPTFPDTVHRDLTNTQANGDTVPGTSEAVDVTDVRKAVLAFVPTDKSATYEYDLHGGKKTGDTTSELFLVPGTRNSYSGNIMKGVHVIGTDYLFVHMLSLSADDIKVEVGPIEYESS